MEAGSTQTVEALLLRRDINTFETCVKVIHMSLSDQSISNVFYNKFNIFKSYIQLILNTNSALYS